MSLHDFPKNCFENLHLFLSAFLVSFTGIILGVYYKNIPVFLEYEYITFFIVLLICSIPFIVLDPPVWYCIFMTSFSHMLFLKEFHTLCLINTFLMLIALLVTKATNKDTIEEENGKMFNSA